MNFPKTIKLSEGEYYFPTYEYWVPDYSDITLPRKRDGRPFTDPEDYEAYLNWLVVYMDNTDFPLNPHHQEVMADPTFEKLGAEHLGLCLGEVANSLYYWFVEPRFDYPEDYLLDPRPERVCDPASVEWDDQGINENGELVHGMVALRTFLIFDFMCWKAIKEYDKKRLLLPEGVVLFSDLGWRPLLKVALSKTDDWLAKRNSLKRFH